MFTIWGGRSGMCCDGTSRRDFLRFGSLGLAGTCAPSSLLADNHRGRQDGSVIMVYLPGGPTQHETFDPKPDAPNEIRGSFGTISTKVPGVQFCELLPKLASLSDKFSIVRTLTGMLNRHESFQCYTGRPGGRPDDRDPAGGWPTLGSVASKLLGPDPHGVVPYVDACEKMGHRPYNNQGVHDGVGTNSWPGITGPDHVPFALNGEVRSDLTLNGIDKARLENRKELLATIGQYENAALNGQMESLQRQAFGLLTSNRLADALDLSKESQVTRDRYGYGQNTDPSFGAAKQDPQLFLLARRLVEAGVRCVTISFGAWDWHANREGTIEYLSKRYLPVFDQTLAVFLSDLEERGLLERTSVVAWGEFGRTPRINAKGGRDHWPNTQSVLLAGGGIPGGTVLGKTDPTGGVPVDRPVHVQEIFATLYQTLGIDVNLVKIPDFNGRPRYLVDENRQPIAEFT
ncbi:MAG: DUF1501 domain-containing protein [Planctomycetaceae bacterium]|nr:DUF1501 domain-containing protein [Planctomycetaceae bacterium]